MPSSRSCLFFAKASASTTPSFAMAACEAASSLSAGCNSATSLLSCAVFLSVEELSVAIRLLRRRLLFQPRDHVADQSLSPRQKGSSPLLTSACMAEGTRDANCSNSIESSLIARTLIFLTTSNLNVPPSNDNTERDNPSSPRTPSCPLQATLVVASNSTAFPWQPCLVSTNAVVSSASVSDVIFKSAVTVAN